eukprot:5329953-Heterocapsa_arctica.AAC.1
MIGEDTFFSDPNIFVQTIVVLKASNGSRVFVYWYVKLWACLYVGARTQTYMALIGSWNFPNSLASYIVT